MSSVYVLLIVIVIAASYVYFRSIKKINIRESENDLAIISELKANQITNWRQERLDDAFTLTPYYVDARKFKHLSDIGDSIVRQEFFCKWTADIHKNPEYDGIYLYDTSLKLIAFGCSGGEHVPLDKYGTGQGLKAIQTKKIIFSDLYRNDFDQTIDLDIYVPVFETSLNTTKVIGLIVLKINPYKFLYPLLQASPGLDKTMETYLVREKDDSVQYLNELKYLKDSALTLRQPSAKEGYLDPLAVGDKKLKGEGLDYRGVPVLVSLRSIPGTSWQLIEKIDKAEVNEPVRERAYYVIVLDVIFVVGLGAWLGIMWYGQLVGFYRKQYTFEVERKSMTKKYDYLIKFANDIIMMMNKDMRVVEANDKALRVYQYTHDELAEMTFNDLVTTDSLESVKTGLLIVDQKGSNIFRATHKRKDGTTFPVEVSMQHFVIEWIEYYQAIIRDISERGDC